MRGGFVVLIFVTQVTWAQFNYVIDQSIPVSIQEGSFITMPWAGGLNATQFNTIDLNGDGNQDLAIFDRTSDRVITFINDNNQYRYAPEYEIYFPTEITNWMLVRDYNGDGKKDIFTGDNLGIKVYKNTTPAGGPLQWQQFYFTASAGPKSSVLLTTGTSIKITVQLNGDDLPAISDADGDGDLDLFVPKYQQGATIEFHKNLSVENSKPLDSLDFARTPQAPTAWGGVTECDCGDFAFNNDPCNEGGRINHAGGKSLLHFDADGDGDFDMLISESECNQLYLLRNDGTTANPIITTALPFPIGNSAAMISYPTAFFEDVDFDGAKDLIATPNIFAREFLQTNLRRSVSFYKNTGTTSSPVFSAPNRAFIQENMIDVGDNSVPAFFDADGDSDLDLFIGCYNFNLSGSIWYFENVGTQSLPSFKLITNNFMNITTLGLINIKPSFADVNGDSKIDLVFTGSNQFGTNTQLYYLPNQSGSGSNFALPVPTGFLLLSTENVTVTDVDLDGKADVLLGKQDGSVQYWQNRTTGSNPDYHLQSTTYLGLGVNILRRNPACTVADIDSDGKSDLMFGDQAGKLTIISDFRNSLNASHAVSNIVYNPIEQDYTSPNLGGRVWPTVANLFKTNKPAIIVGNTQGGLHVLKHDESVQLPETPVIDVYPNPVAKESTGITVRIDRPAIMILLTSLGQEMGPPIELQTFQDYNLQLQGFSRGIYLIYFIVDGKRYIRKIMVY